MPPKARVDVKNPAKSRFAKDYDDDSSVIGAPSVLDTDIESEIDPIDADVNYKIQSVQCSELRNLNSFFADPKLINQPNDPTTNIINRQLGKCYNIPDKKIPSMFKLLEVCRRTKQRLMFNEKQQDPSGIMLDFDIYQDEETDQITTEILYTLCQKILELITKILNFSDTKKETFYIGITRRPRITFSDDKDCYKDGFHLIIPSIKVSRGVKKLLISKLVEGELLDQIMADITPATNIKIKNETYQHKHFLDTMSASVPTFFIGSSTKKGHAPYTLTHIYEATVNFETKSIMLVDNDKLMKSKSFNVCHEFSLNYECPGGVIKKIAYEPLEKYLLETQEMNKVSHKEEEANRNFGELSTNSIHDQQISELKDLLDILPAKYYTEYKYWRNVLCALANTSASYKDLAEYFSRKWPKFNYVDFEKMWLQVTKGPAKNRNALTLGSLHYWAKQEVPDRYDQMRKTTTNSILNNMVYEGYKEGLLSHADIADLLYRLLKFKFVTDTPKNGKKRIWYEFILDGDDHIDGELYKWREWRDDQPVSLHLYISQTLPKLFDKTFVKVKKNFDDSADNLSKYYKKVLENLKATMRKLGDRMFTKNVIDVASVRFSQCGFSELLDKDPLIRGVQNGILKLGWAGKAPQLIQGHHSYKISKYTDVPYVAFNPYDPMTKKIIKTIRGMFPDNESDTHEFTMYFLASTLDGNPKESMIMLMVGPGSNGKSFLVELHKSAIGETYGVKMQTSFLTAKSTSADAATPAIMQLKDATFAYYSETNKHEVLNAARMKEITGQETLAGRRLNENMVNFKPKCHHLVLSNNDFDIQSHDHGTWRRVIYNPLKIRFVDTAVEKLDENNPYQREADTSITDVWTADPEVRGRYLGYMVWMHYWLYSPLKRYHGKVMKVPHPHIQFETEKYKLRQDVTSEFLQQRLVKTAEADAQTPMADEIQKYISWFAKTQGGILAAKGLAEQFQNNGYTGKFIKHTKRGLFMEGHRFLDHQEALGEGEEMAIKDVVDLEMAPGNAGIVPETPDQYYERVCAEYDKYKDLFTSEAKFDVDTSVSMIIGDDDTPETPASSDLADASRSVEINGRILPSGIVLRSLAEPTVNFLTDEFITGVVSDIHGYLPDDDDSDVDLDNSSEGFIYVSKPRPQQSRADNLESKESKDKESKDKKSKESKDKKSKENKDNYEDMEDDNDNSVNVNDIL